MSLVLSQTTKLDALLKEYPFLLETLVSFDSKLKLLKNPIIRRTLGKKASLLDVSKTADINFNKLVSVIKDSIEKNDGIIELDGVHTAEEKKEILKQIVLDLHAGKDQEELRIYFNETLGDVDALEIADMEQSLINEGELTSDQITKLCDIHVSLFDDSLAKQNNIETKPGHPLHNYRMENDIARNILKKLRKKPTNELIEDLRKINTHYVRLQNQLFPVLERLEFTAPTMVMWAKQDEIRDLFKKGIDAVNEIIIEVEEMIYKEEKILFPTSVDLLSDSDWDMVGKGEEEIGFAWITPSKPLIFDLMESTPDISPHSHKDEEEINLVNDKINLNTGALTLEQINLLLTNLPVETSYIDENDEVLYYSDHSHRIFPRSPGAIGRKVQNCHPQKSVSTVNRILESFKDGRKSYAEFWIPFIGKIIHIRYFALRDENGKYKGVIEVTQDITDIQKLKGEQRLLSWDDLN